MAYHYSGMQTGVRHAVTFGVFTMFLASLFFYKSSVADAHISPTGCTSNGVSLSFSVLRQDGVTPIGGADTVAPGETIKYRATLSHAGGTNCNYDGGDLDINTPDGVNHDVDGGSIPLVTSVTPFQGQIVSYVVDSSDVVATLLNASAVYSGGTSHSSGPGVTPVGATTPASTQFAKLNPGIITHVHNPAHVDVTGSSVSVGTLVHDQVTVSQVLTGPMPTGTATFTLQTGLTCQGQQVGVPEVVALVSGVAESTAAARPAGEYSYLVTYSGDANYEQVDAACEPFSVVAPLEIEKTVVTSYDRKWNWTIDKSADQTELMLANGEAPFSVNYDVTVAAASETMNVAVTGVITITNPVGNADAHITDVTDVLSISADAVSVTCEEVLPYDLAGGDSLECTYEVSLPGLQNQSNTATVVTTGSVPGANVVEPVVFGSPDSDIDECIDVTDDNVNGGFLGTVCAGDGDNDETFSYSVSFGAHPDADVILECGEFDHPNTASFLAVDDENETAQTDDSMWSVHITVNCQTGCTLTQGYWKTHNDSFKGGAPTDDNWLNILPLAEKSGFFTLLNSYPVAGPNAASMTWFAVFNTPPKGNAYYQLAHQYMAAVLNVLNGASVPAEVQTALDASQAFFVGNTPAQFDALGKKAALRKNVITWAGILGSYNEGAIGPGHCDEQLP